MRESEARSQKNVMPPKGCLILLPLSEASIKQKAKSANIWQRSADVEHLKPALLIGPMGLLFIPHLLFIFS